MSSRGGGSFKCESFVLLVTLAAKLRAEGEDQGKAGGGGEDFCTSEQGPER